MDRFTKKIPDGRNILEKDVVFVKNPKYGYFVEGKAIDKFAEYEDAEEQGLLLKLPCKVGDTLYINNFRCCWQDEYEIPYEVGVLNIGMNEIHTYMEVLLDDGMIYHFNFSDIGKTIFLTKAEAEEALSKMGASVVVDGKRYPFYFESNMS